jgi:3',5'-cyclic AMP phosphodiesterase CpdA
MKQFTKIQKLTFAILLILLTACEKFEYNPYQTDNEKRPENLNKQNLEKIKLQEIAADDTVTILFSGDSQRFYRQLDALVDKTNSLKDVDFFILAGDISDFGLLREFLWVYEKLETLKVPYLCVVGNHDLTGNGSDIYESMFGPKNFSFVYKGHKFLFHDTNSREYKFDGSVPNLGWIRQELQDTTVSWFVGVSHVPPYDSDFDRALEFPYKNLLATQPGFILSLNGHLHDGGDSFHYDDHVRYITSSAVEKDECILLKLADGKIFKEKIYY